MSKNRRSKMGHFKSVVFVLCLVQLSVSLAQEDAVVIAASRLFGNPGNFRDCEQGVVIEAPVYTYTFTRDAQVLQRRKFTLHWPPVATLNQIIQCIDIVDLVENGRGGYTSLVAGGVGQTFVDLKFTSRIGRKMSFKIIIYAVDP